MRKVRELQHIWRLAAVMPALFGLLLAAPVQAREPATLVIHVENISPKGGMLRLGLYDEARYPDDDSVPVASADVQAHPGETVVTLPIFRPAPTPSRRIRTSIPTTRWTRAGSVFLWSLSVSRTTPVRISPSPDSRK